MSGQQSDRKAVIKNADMTEAMQQQAIDCAWQAIDQYNIEKDIAAFIKKVGVPLLVTGRIIAWGGEEGGGGAGKMGGFSCRASVAMGPNRNGTERNKFSPHPQTAGV